LKIIVSGKLSERQIIKEKSDKKEKFFTQW